MPAHLLPRGYEHRAVHDGLAELPSRTAFTLGRRRHPGHQRPHPLGFILSGLGMYLAGRWDPPAPDPRPRAPARSLAAFVAGIRLHLRSAHFSSTRPWAGRLRQTHNGCRRPRSISCARWERRGWRAALVWARSVSASLPPWTEPQLRSLSTASLAPPSSSSPRSTRSVVFSRALWARLGLALLVFRAGPSRRLGAGGGRERHLRGVARPGLGPTPNMLVMDLLRPTYPSPLQSPSSATGPGR